MKKISKKFLQILMLISMIFSSLQTPLYVLADTVTTETAPQKGDMKLGENGSITQTGSVSTTSTSTDGKIEVKKTVTEYEEQPGKYKVDFEIKGKETEDNNTPVYAVVVFDRSGSMCITGNSNNCNNMTKWNNAVDGAQEFAGALIENLPNSKVALVTFATTATKARGFEHANFEDSLFGSPDGGTNLHDGLLKAQDYLTNSIPETDKATAQKYIVVISDGQPTYYIYTDRDGDTSVGGWGSSTSENTLDYTLETADSIKEDGIQIFSIGYSLPTGSVYNDDYTYDGTEYSSLTAKQILKFVATKDTAEDIENGIIHYQDADPTKIAEIFEEIAKLIIMPGKNATLIDSIGSNFKIVQEGNNTYGGEYTSSVIPQITETAVTFTFDIEINQDSPTGWYQTNAGFTLEYTDAAGQEQVIEGTEDPYVYWVQNQYDYIVNYYKDSITEANRLALETRQAPAGTVINESNVEKDKYLTQAGEGYEFNSITPTSITITNDGQTKEINVLYTIKKYSYDVNYYYDGILDNELSNTVNDVNHGTVVTSEDYYLSTEEIKEGYKLDVTNTDKGNITIDSNGESIDIYYIKDSFEFKINYHFNGILDSNLTKNEEATYETVIKAEDNTLTNDQLVENNYSDYFLHPTTPYDKAQIQIGTNPEENVLNIYYINTFVAKETIDKTTKDIDKITSSQDVVKYQVEYKSTVKNVKANEKITITIIDTLPYEIDETLSNLNGGVYSNKTITWTIEKEVLEFTENYEIIETITYEVVYKDFADLSIEENNNLVNNVIGKTTVANKTTEGAQDSTETPVEIEGSLTVKHIDETGKNLLAPVTTTEKVGTPYETQKETIYGYTFKEVTGSETGKYTEEDITVTYVYTKNDGKTTENEVTKAQINPILGTTSTFKYVLTYNGKIENYVGPATVTIEDILPYEVLSIEYDETICSYDETSRKLTCTKSEEITETDTEIDATFEIVVIYKNLTSPVDLEITNTANSTLTYGKDTPDTDTDKVTDIVKSGKVTAIYVDETNNTLSDSVTTTGLVDTEYQTNKKTIYGYTFKEVKGSETGKYTEEEITVTYVYTKNEGTTETNEVEKVGPENITSVNGVFNYTLTYTGKITDYVGNATLTLKDTLPYEIDEELSTYDNRCTYNNKVLTCTGNYEISETNQEITDTFNLSLVFKNVDSDKVTNKVDSTLDYGKDTPDTDTDETETEVFKGTVIATYKNTEGETLRENITKEGLAGANYETEILEFLGYTLTEVPTNQNGEYLANTTIYVNYIYSKNIGTSEEELVKVGPQKVNDINAPFEYKITYNLEIKDYVGDAKITLTDHLPYEIDEEKSYLGDVCKYVDGKIVCEYLQTITNKDDSIINIEENLVLYYKNVTSNEVTNRIESLVQYGSQEKTDEDEYTTEIPYGTLKVNYVTDEGKTLSPTVITTDLVGASYTTEQKVFDNYYLKEVVGNKTGVYAEEETEVTYVYSLVPLPPQTGVEGQVTNYIGLFIFAALVLVLKRRYL